MCKKVLSLLLTMVVITGIFGTAAFAVVPQVETDYDTDGETVKGYYYVDNFDYPYDVTTLNQGYPGYNNYSGDTDATDKVKISSTVFNGHGNSAPTQIDADGGRDGKGAVVINGAAITDRLEFKYGYLDSLTSNTVVVAKYDVKFAELPDVISSTYTETINLSGNMNFGSYILGVKKVSGQSAYFYPGTDNSSAIDTSKWYTIVYTLKPAGITRDESTNAINGGTIERTVSVLDESGTLIVSNSISGNATSDYYRKLISPYAPGNKVSGAKLYIDNASLSVYDTTKYAPSLTNTPSIANRTVGIGQQTTRVSFDQPISTAAAVVKNLTDTTKEDITCTVTATTDALWSYDITIPAGTLAIETEYQLDLSGFKNNGGTACADSVKFETQKATAVDYSLSADFTNPGTLSARKFSNYPFLYFGTGTNAAGSTTVTDGVVNVTGHWDYTAGNRLRTTDTINTSDTNVTYAVTYRMKIGATENGTTPTVAVGLNYPTSTSDMALNYLANAGQIAEFTTVTAEDGTTNRVIRNVAINNETSPWSPDTWYNIIWTVNSTEQCFRLYDGNGTLIFDRTRQLSDMSATATPDYYMFLAQAGNLDGATLSFDDITLWTLDSTKEWSQPRFVSNTEAEEIGGSADVNMTLTFDQPMITEAAQYKVLDENNRFAGEVSVIQEDFCKQKLLLSGLDYGQNYTLIYNEVENLIGQALYGANDKECVPDINFMTGNDEKNPFAVQGETVVSGLTENSTITFDLYSRDGGTVKLLCALYDVQGKLLGIAELDVAELESRTVTPQTITLTQDYSTARKIKIFGWNNLTELKPLMEAETLTVPRES